MMSLLLDNLGERTRAQAQAEIDRGVEAPAHFLGIEYYCPTKGEALRARSDLSLTLPAEAYGAPLLLVPCICGQTHKLNLL